MKKRLLSGLILMVLVCSVLGSSLAAPELPPFTATILNHPTQAREFLASCDLDALYNALNSEAKNHIFAMNFTSTDENPSQSDYADHIPDFVLRADKDIWVYLIGYYKAFGATLVIGPVQLKANRDFKIMDFLFKEAGVSEGWNWPYSYVADYVNDFTCAAVPVSDELFAAADKINLTLPDLTTLDRVLDPANAPALNRNTPVSLPGVTKLTIGLNLYDPDTKAATPVTSQSFYHHVPVPEAAPAVPQTGDSALPLLWGVAACTSFISMLLLRRRKAA